MIKFDRRSIIQLLLLLLFFAGGTYALFAFGVIDLLMDRQRMLQFIHEHRADAVTIFIGLQALQVVAAPVPGEVTGFVGGYFFGTFWGIVYSTIGLTIGSWVAFVIARMLGRHIVERLASSEVMERYDYVMKHKGLFLAFLMFLIPGFPKDILCYILGLGHMRQRDFLVISTSGRLLGTVLLTLGGTYLRDARYGALFLLAGFGLCLVLLTMVYRNKIEHWLRRMRVAERLKARREKRMKLKEEERK